MKKFLILLLFLFLSIPMCFAKERINVAVNIDNNYATYALLTFNSILKNNKSNSDYTFYVLHDGLSIWNKLRMKWFVKRHKQKIEFIYVNLPKLLGRNGNVFGNSWAQYISNIGMARIFIPNLLPKSIHKCLYLDCDVLVLDDIKELWDTDINEYAVGMCSDSNSNQEGSRMMPELETYYNSGIILMNIDYLRKHNSIKQMVKCISCNTLRYIDQDAINIVLKNRIKFLNQKWNYIYYSLNNVSYFPKADKHIVHYFSPNKPWHFIDNMTQYPLIRLYYSYWKKSDLKVSYLLNLYKNYCNYFKYSIPNHIERTKCFYINKFNKWERNKTYKVSVIVPVYNGDWYIDRALNCLINQTFKDFEIIFVNDGSTDNTASILEDKMLTFNNIKVYHHSKNQGAGAARNTGLKFAKGNYVIFLDVDDTYNKNLLKFLYQKALETDSDITITPIICDKKNINELSNKAVFNYKDVADYLYLGIRSCVWNKLYKREFLIKNELSFDKFRHGEDVDFVNRATIMADKITTAQNSLVTYNWQAPNSLSKKVNDSPYDSVEAWLKTRNFLINKGIYKELERSYLYGIIDSFLWTYDRLNDTNKELLIKKYKPIFKEMGIFDKDFTYYYNIYDFIKLKKLMGEYPPEVIKELETKTRYR